MHIRPGYREKSANLQGTLQLHVRFYNKISRWQRPHNENWRAHYSLRAHSMSTKASMSQGKFMRDLGMCTFLSSVVRAPHDFKCLACFLTVFAHVL